MATVGRHLESPSDWDKTWSTIVLGIGSEAAEVALKDFNDKNVSAVLRVDKSLLTFSRDSQMLVNFMSVPSVPCR